MLSSDLTQSMGGATHAQPPRCRSRRLRVLAWRGPALVGAAAANNMASAEPAWTPERVRRGKTQREGLQQGRWPSVEEDHLGNTGTSWTWSSQDLMGPGHCHCQAHPRYLRKVTASRRGSWWQEGCKYHRSLQGWGIRVTSRLVSLTELSAPPSCHPVIPKQKRKHKLVVSHLIFVTTAAGVQEAPPDPFSRPSPAEDHRWQSSSLSLSPRQHPQAYEH